MGMSCLIVSDMARMCSSLFLVTFIAFFMAIPAAAQPQFEIGGGISFTRDNESTKVASVAWVPHWQDFHGGALRWDVGAMHVRGRNHSRFNNADDVSFIHAGLRYEHPNGLIGGFGVGVQHGKTDALSGDPQFISSLGWRWNRVSLMLRHISNGSMHGPNEGENVLQVAWRF